ncbi:MAG TPA: hypothetical protein VFZ47_03420, partial [Chitinophagaceae bacterium]
MKKILLVAVMAMIMQGLPAQHRFVGIWEGKVHAGVELRVVFTIKQDQSQKLTAIMDLPDQGITGIVASNLVINDDSIHISIKEFSGTYSGKQSDSATINGIWKQGIGTALQLKKVEKVQSIHRA